MKFQTTPKLTFPRLAWSALVTKHGVSVEHGCDVEVGDGWIAEGVWDAPFGGPDFDKAAAFWGTGLLVRGNGVTAIPSVSLCDRLLLTKDEEGWRISNSLPLLLGRSGLHLDSAIDYRRVGHAIASGVLQYDMSMPVSGGREFIQIFHRLVRIEDDHLSLHDRAQANVEVDYCAYVGRVRAVVERIAENMSSPLRKKRVNAFATASSGYDSACTAVFAKAAGARFCATSKESNRTWIAKLLAPGDSDSGEPVARALGLETRFLTRVPSDREIQFRSASCIEPELAFDGLYGLFGAELGAVFTGFYGDTLWGIFPPHLCDSDMRWREPSGVSLSEARLYAGYFNVALPFLDARRRPLVNQLSQSEEMKDFRVGGSYDRPIPRRILEEAGVPREAFGKRKRAILNLDQIPVNPVSRASFLQWLDNRGPISSSEYMRRLRLSTAAFYLHGVQSKFRVLLGGKEEFSQRDRWWASHAHPHNLMLLWATETLSATYRS